MTPKALAVLLAVASLSGCAHTQLAGSDLARIQRPVFVSRIVDGAGPRSQVFREDGSYSEKIQKLGPAEADRRLQVKLARAMTRFEVSERLRAQTLANLPREEPWVDAVDPASVASVLQSFLVEEVPANEPDFDLLAPLGADAVLEFVIERFGVRSRRGRAGVFVEGYGRLFFLDSRRQVWRRSFRVDQVEAELPHLDPFRVAREPELYRRQLTDVLDAVAAQFVADLSPQDRIPRPPTEGTPSPGPTPRPVPKPDDGELPAPDPR